MSTADERIAEARAGLNNRAADAVRCELCDEIVFVWPQSRLDGQAFSAASDRLRAHLELAHGLVSMVYSIPLRPDLTSRP